MVSCMHRNAAIFKEGIDNLFTEFLHAILDRSSDRVDSRGSFAQRLRDIAA
jgi:hypothetical protein